MMVRGKSQPTWKKKQAERSVDPKLPSEPRAWLGISVKAWFLLSITLLMCGLALWEVPGVNGPSYWTWPWRSLRAVQWLVMLVCAVPAVAALWLYQFPHPKTWHILLALICSSMMLKLGCVLSQSDPVGLAYWKQVTWSPDATSYYFDAARIVATVEQDQEHPLFWFCSYDELIRTTGPSSLSLHTITKPAGPLCYYFFFVWFFDYGNPATIVACGFTLIVLSLLSIPATYWCIRQFVDSPRAALIAAAVVALAPGFNLFPTKLDALWVGLCALTIGTWQVTLVRGGYRCAVLLGLCLAFILFVGFQLLTIGLFMSCLPAIVLADQPMLKRYLEAIRKGMPAIAMALGLHVVLALMSGYNTWKVFQANLWAQSQLLLLPELQPRQAPWTTFWDLYDYSLGGGWGVAIVFLMGLFNGGIDRRMRLIGVAALSLMLVIAVLALIPAETARCWLFLSAAPLILIASELARWSTRQQVLVLGCILTATLTIHGKMAFILP